MRGRVWGQGCCFRGEPHAWGKEEKLATGICLVSNAEWALLGSGLGECAPTLPCGGLLGTREDLSQALSSAHPGGVKGQTPRVRLGEGAGAGVGEAMLAPGVLAFSLGIARTFFLSREFCGVAWD